MRLATKEEVAEVKRQGGPDITGLEHEITSEHIRHLFNEHGRKNESKKHPDQRPITKDDISLLPAVIDAPTEIIVKNIGKNLTSIVYGRDFGKGKKCYVERIIETSEKNKPRLTLKTAWVKATTGAKPSTSAVYTPHRNSNILFVDGRVNPDSVSKVVDENGEPKPVFHGTHTIFDIFDRNKGDLNDAGWSGEGHYFYEDYSEAAQYAMRKDGRIMEAFLNVREPYYLSDEERAELVERDDREYSIEFSDRSKSDGFDGVFYNGDLRKEWTVFEPTQIKSATDNAGLYGPEAPSTLFQFADAKMLEKAATFEDGKDYYIWLKAFGELPDDVEGFTEEQTLVWFNEYVKRARQAVNSTRISLEGIDTVKLDNPTAADQDAEFIDIIEQEEKFKDFVETAAGIIEEGPFDDESSRLIDNINSQLSDQGWQMAIKSKGRMGDKQRKRLVTLIERAPRDYRAIYAEVMNRPDLAVKPEDSTAEQLKRRLPIDDLLRDGIKSLSGNKARMDGDDLSPDYDGTGKMSKD